jgi:hypothetical protein
MLNESDTLKYSKKSTIFYCLYQNKLILYVYLKEPKYIIKINKNYAKGKNK